MCVCESADVLECAACCMCVSMCICLRECSCDSNSNSNCRDKKIVFFENTSEGGEGTLPFLCVCV